MTLTLSHHYCYPMVGEGRTAVWGLCQSALSAAVAHQTSRVIETDVDNPPTPPPRYRAIGSEGSAPPYQKKCDGDLPPIGRTSIQRSRRQEKTVTDAQGSLSRDNTRQPLVASSLRSLSPVCSPAPALRAEALLSSSLFSSSSSSPFSLAGTGSMRLSCRRASTASLYPSPGLGGRKTVTKPFNFLTADRLIRPQVDHGPTAAELRKGNVHLNKLTSYRESLLEEIDRKIRYFPKHVSDFIFHAAVHDRVQVKTFTGQRRLPAILSTRIELMVLDQLRRKSERDHLIELMQRAGVPVPSEELWSEFTDSTTGDITCNLVYSKYVTRALRRFSAARSRGFKNTSFSNFYIAMHLLDPEKVPALDQWYAQLGPPQVEELGFRRRLGVERKVADLAAMLEEFGRKEVEAAVKRLTQEECETMMQTFKENAKVWMDRLERHHLFTQTVLLAVYSLPEMRVLRSPVHAFKMEFNSLWYIQQGGAYYPDPSGGDKAWIHLPQEEKNKYCPFGVKPQGGRSGGWMFTKYCQRDYGLSVEESRGRLAELSDLQLAAINYPYHVSIASESQSTVARSFRRFLKDMALAYGLARRENTNRLRTSRLFTALMRNKWVRLSVEQRRPYEDEEIAGIFPLQPTKHQQQQHEAMETGEGGASSSTSSSLSSSGAPSSPSRVSSRTVEWTSLLVSPPAATKRGAGAALLEGEKDVQGLSSASGVVEKGRMKTSGGGIGLENLDDEEESNHAQAYMKAIQEVEAELQLEEVSPPNPSPPSQLQPPRASKSPTASETSSRTSALNGTTENHAGPLQRGEGEGGEEDDVVAWWKRGVAADHATRKRATTLQADDKEETTRVTAFTADEDTRTGLKTQSEMDVDHPLEYSTKDCLELTVDESELELSDEDTEGDRGFTL